MTESTGMQNEAIASSSDVILVVGEPAQIKLLVSSAVLTGASKVFAALLGPDFLEGQGKRTSTQQQEITLLEDDATAMSDMCRLLHGKYVEGFLRTPGTDRILAFAIVVDKYACADALRLQSQAILYANLHHFTHPDFERFGRQIAAAYLLDHSLLFTFFTRRLIQETTQEAYSLLETAFGGLIPTRVLDAMDKKRMAARYKVIFDLPLLGEKRCSSSPDCLTYDQLYMDVLYTGFAIKYWPPKCGPAGTRTMKEMIEHVAALTPIYNLRTCNVHSCKAHIKTSSLKDFANHLNTACGGLCLGCVKESKADLATPCVNSSHASG